MQYLSFHLQVIGPRLMENRKPFELRKVLIVYNFLQVIFSCWLFWEASSAGWFNGYNLRCQPVDYSRSVTAMRVSVNIYFIIERKKNAFNLTTIHLQWTVYGKLAKKKKIPKTIKKNARGVWQYFCKNNLKFLK